jgi:hypothetical protein
MVMADSKSFQKETTKFKEMENPISERMAGEDAEVIFEERENKSIDEIAFSVETDYVSPTENLKTSEKTDGATCTSPSVIECGVCSISCPVGKEALCKPGYSANPGHGVCTILPSCSCV